MSAASIAGVLIQEVRDYARMHGGARPDCLYVTEAEEDALREYFGPEFRGVGWDGPTLILGVPLVRVI